MTLITPEQAAADAEDLLASVQDTIRALRKEIESLATRVHTGEEFDAAKTSRTVNATTGLLATCQKVEHTLGECRRTQAGIAHGGYALDLEKARAEIGCKLDRLRCTALAGCISE
ncbi:MAG: hypothetical protein WBC93_18900 [Sulfitobacter sp.]